MSRRLLLFILGILILGGLVQPVSAQEQGPFVYLLTAEGALTPAMSEYLSRGIRAGEQRGAEAVILQLNTPGGSTTLMEAMYANILDSDVPVIVFVYPRGAMAGSAGTLITLSGHASAMAPETIIGAASPVGGEGEDIGETLESKLKESYRAAVRSMAARRPAEAIRLAEDMIEKARAVSASEAFEIGLIDFIATDVYDLLRQLEGFTVFVKGEEQVLRTAGAEVVEFRQSFIEQLLGLLTNPNIVFLLITIGVQAILIELSSPGGWVAGFTGIVSLALATYGLGILPVNWFGLIFLVLAFILFVLDIKAPTHGALTATGVASLIIGALVLFNSPNVPRFQRVSVPLIVGASLASGALFFMVLMVALRAQRAPVRTGQEGVVGKVGVARSNLDPNGNVQVGGELWSAELLEGEESIPVGARVKVVRVEGVHVFVKRA